MEEKDWQFHGGQFNYLIKRLNNPKSQANLYFKSGLGLALSDFRDLKNKTEPAFFFLAYHLIGKIEDILQNMKTALIIVLK